jgi:Domain of unknown function (DUF4037)/Nucleotidyltransferase domain
MSEPIIERLSEALRPVRGLSALALGGSRARAAAGPGSDYDFGLYYEADAPLDIGDLRAAIAPLVDDPDKAAITEIGGWGPWINGGGWLSIAGRKVDLLYRDLARVRAVVADCAAGRIAMAYQPGHPHGFCSAIWMGEIALCALIRDDDGVLVELKARTEPFPEALRQALIARFHWEVAFAIENAEIAIARGEQTHIAGCVYRALCCIAQVLFALNRRYLINEKGALAEAGGFPDGIAGAGQTAAQIWAAIGTRDFGRAIGLVREIAAQLDGVVARVG